MFDFFRPPIFVFDAAALERVARQHADAYRTATPFPHVVIDDFLPRPAATRLLRAFPDTRARQWLDWKKRDTLHQPGKQGIGHASRLDGASPYLHNMLYAFNSYPFLRFLEILTGIGKLLPDPHFHGGGIHQILRGGKLAMHTDSNDLQQLDLYRRLNILLYLNKDWRPEYNGNLELWNPDTRECEKEIPPLFNRLVVFITNKRSLHGHPKVLNTPPGVTRKSLALYYFTSRPAADEHYDGVIDWQDCPDTAAAVHED